MNLASISVFLRFAAIAGFFRLWWESTGVWIGADAGTRVAAMLGVGMALAVAPWVLRHENDATFPFWRKRGPEILFAGSWVLCLLPFLGSPGSWALPSDRDFSIGIALLHAAAFSMSSLFVRRSLDRCEANLPSCLLGLAAGVFLHETILLPGFGWIWSEMLWAVLLVFACAISVLPETEPEETRAGFLALAACALAGLAAGALLSTSAVFLEAQLSSTRWSGVSILGISLLGLGLGALLVAAWREKSVPEWLGLSIAVLGGAAAIFMSMKSLAALAGSDPLAQKSLPWKFPAKMQELFLCLEALGLGTVILGACVQLLRPRRAGLSLLVLGVGAGFLARGWVLDRSDEKGQPWLASLAPHPPGHQYFEMKVTEDGILRRVRVTPEGNATAIRWNRDAISRPSEWLELEQEEIFLPARLHPQAQRALVLGTPFGSHRTALALSGAAKVEIADPIPPFLEAHASSIEPARLSALPQYDWICALSTPKLAAGRTLLFTEDFFRLASRALRPGGSLVVWIELRAMPEREIGTLLRSYLAVFPAARMWLGQDLYAGPLLALESGAAGIEKAPGGTLVHLVAQGARLAEIAGEGPRNTLDRPRLEFAAPTLPSPRGLPQPGQLRALAGLLAPSVEKRTGLFYLLDSLAIHAEEQGPASAFAGRLERIRMSQDEVEQATVGLELHPDSAPMLRHLEKIGLMLLEKRDSESYQHALRFFPRWVEAAPANAAFAMMLARTHHDLLDDALALPFAEKAAALAPERAQTHELLGDIQCNLGAWKPAIEAYATANALQPQAPKLSKKLGLAYLGAGELGPAQDWLERAQTALPGDREIQEGLAKIRGR